MFKPFGEAVHKRYTELSRHELFVVDTADIFASYLAAFPEGTNPVFRKSTEHDCSCCKQFVRRLGNLVAIIDGEVLTVWDHHTSLPHPYNIVSARMASLVRQAPIRTVFRTKERDAGTAFNFDTHDTSIKWNHFYGHVSDRHYARDAGTARAGIESTVQVLRRGLTELRPNDLDTVLELIEANAIYRGEEHEVSVREFRKLMRKYEASPNKNLFVWSNIDSRVARFRNTVIGTLITDLSSGVPLEQAVASFEAKVAPQNYKRPSALITPRMVEQASEKLKELGLEGAIHRRYARLSDISVNNVLFVDNAARAKMKDGIAHLLKDSVKTTVKPENAFPITMGEFMPYVLPNTKSMGLLVQNKHRPNFVSMTCGDGDERLFKWNNNFAWSYAGEVTDSIKEKVKRAGGRVVGAKLRVSLAWHNYDDLDLHCRTPRGEHIFFRNKAGILDVDMNAGAGTTREPVENMSWMNTLRDGEYFLFVHQYQQRDNTDYGFCIEIETDGRLDQYSYDKRVTGEIPCFTITVYSGRVVEIVPNKQLKGGAQSQEVWGIKTETVIPVETLIASPNHWDGQSIGNKHWFFILKNCINPEPTRGIYNEFLRSELEQHRKVFEVLGSKTKCEPTQEQLSGLGFSSTRKDEAIVVADNRAFNIKF